MTAARRLTALAVVLLLVAPAPSVFAASAVVIADSPTVPGPTQFESAASEGSQDLPPQAGPRVRGGLAEETDAATVSVIVRLRTAPLSDILLEMRAVHGSQDGWGKDVQAQASARLALRDAALSIERAALNETLAAAGIDALYARDYRFLVNAVNLRNIPASAVRALADAPGVLHIQRDTEVHVLLDDSVPLIHATDVWNRTDTSGRNITGKGSIIANIDTGVDYSHPDLGGTLNRTADLARFLAGNHTTFAGGWDFVNGDNDPWDDHFHGTHVAGIIGANGTIKGVAPGSRQLGLKVLSGSGYGTSSDVIAAMEFATDPDRNPLTDDGADASSMSLGSWAVWPDDVEALAADASTLLGTVCVIAAGNSGSQLNTIGSPGVSREAITVGSTTKTDGMSGFSSRGPTPALDMKPDVSAPGSGIESTYYNGTGLYVFASGTSMATPHVSGVVALIKQAHPDWNVDNVRSALVDTAVDIGSGAYIQGGGRVDALAAVRAELSASPYKLPLGRLSSSAGSTNATLSFTNVGLTSLTVNFSARDVFGLKPNYTFVNNNTDVNYVTVSPSSATIGAGQTVVVMVSIAPPGAAPAGHYWGYVAADTGTSSLRVPLAYAVRASVLLVDDDISDRSMASAVFDNYASFPSSSNNLSASLDRAGVEHDIYTTVHYEPDGPGELDLKNYALVIWNTGFDYDYNDSFHRHYTLSPHDQAAIASYLDVGGQVWALGESIAWDVYRHANRSVPAGDFLNQYLGVGFVEHDLNTPDPVSGTGGTFMAGASYATNPNWPNEDNNGDFASNLTPSARGFTVLEGPTTDIFGKVHTNASLAVAVNNSTYRSVYWGFEFSWLSTTGAFDDAMTRTLAFFDLLEGPGLPANDLGLEVAVDPLPADWLPLLETAWGRPFDTLASTGQPFNVTVSVVNIGATARLNVAVAVQLLDNASVVQQQATVSFPSVPSLARVSSTLQFASAKHGYLTVHAQLASGDSNPANDMAQSTVLVPNWIDELTSSASGWTLGGSWSVYSGGYWTAPASIGASPGGAANDSAVSPMLNFSRVNASATTGAIRLYLRISGLLTGSDALYVETRNISSQLWTVERTLTAFSATSFWNYFQLGAPLSTLAGTQGQFRLRLQTGASSSSYFFADHFMAWTFHEYGTPMAPGIMIVNSTRLEGQSLDFRPLHSDFVGDANPSNYTYAWEFGDGAVASVRNATHAYADNGTYLARLTVTHNSGVRDLAFLTVVVSNVAPTIGSAGAVINPTNEGSSVTFSASCSDASAQDTVSYRWSFGDGSPNSTNATAAHTYSNEGNFSVQLTCSDEDGGVTVTSFAHAVLNVAPAVVSQGSTPNPSDEGQVVSFTADCSDVGAFDNLTFAWDFGDGSNATGANASHTYADEGNYTVALTCTDTGGGSSSVNFMQAVLNVDPVVVSQTSSANPSDEGASVQFQATCTDDGTMDNIAYEWDFGDGTAMETGAVVNHTYLNDGSADVTVTCTDGDGGTASGTITQNIANVAPTAAIVSANNSFEGDSVTFAGEAFDPGTLDTLQYTWDFGDGMSGQGQNVIHTYRDNGVFTVTLTVTDTAPTSTIAFKTFQVDNVAPTVAAVATGAPLEGSPLNFSAQVTDPGTLDTFSFLWQFGDSQISTLGAASHTYRDDGTYVVNLTVTDKDGGSTTDSFTVIVANAAPNATLAVGGQVPTEGIPVTFMFNATDAGVLDVINVTLDFGDTSAPAHPAPGIGGSFAHSFPDEGAYTVVITVRDEDGGSSSASLVVNVLNAAPLLFADASAYVIGEGGRVDLTANATDLGITDTVTFLWDLGGIGSNVNGPAASVLLEQEGTYRFTVTAADNDGAVSLVTLEIVVQNVAPTMVVTLPTTVSEGVSAQFGAAVTDPGVLDVPQVVWFWGDGEITAGLSVEHTYADAGEHTLTVRAYDEAGGEDLQTFVITVANSAPRVISIELPADALEGTSLDFSSTIENFPGEALTYTWSFGDTTTSTDPASFHSYRNEGQYTVSLTVSDGEGGTSTLTATLTVDNVPPVVNCDVCPLTSVQGKTISFRVSATDPGRDDEFTFSLRLPDGSTLTSTDGIFDFAIEAAGTASVIITANDGDDNSQSTTVDIDVQQDTDRDGLSDQVDTDDDNDGSPDTEDPAPLDPAIPSSSGSGGIPLVWILVLVMAAGAGYALYVVYRRRGDGGDKDA